MRRGSEEKNSGTKKRKWLLPVSIIAGVLLLCVIGIAVFLVENCSGIYVRTSGGRNMVVFDKIGPVVLSNKEKPDQFDGLETGDRVLAIGGALNETYPGQSEAKFVLRLWKGDLEDIPQKDREALPELGRLFEIADSVVAEDEGFPDWGLSLSVKNVTPTGLTLVCTQKGGNPTGELQCGTEYHLIVLEDGIWKDVPTIIEEYGWNSMAYLISEGQDTEFDISWEWLYGKLTAGTYRLTKGFMDFREAGDFDTAKYWVEFAITE